MAASVNSPEDVLNLALVMLGHPHRIGSILDGSEAARKSLDIYAETRDEVLRAKDWPFALKQATGATAAPVVTIVGWPRTLSYPADCLRVRYVSPSTVPSPNYDPQPVLWALYTSGTAKVIAVDRSSAVTIDYVAQVTNPALWEPLFVNALAQALAAKLGPSLRKDMAPAIKPDMAIAAAANADELLPPNDAEAAMPQPAQQVPARPQ